MLCQFALGSSLPLEILNKKIKKGTKIYMFALLGTDSEKYSLQ
jgi:hypothetical protein